MRAEETRSKVRKEYARIAVRQGSCCSGSNDTEVSKKMGYTEEALASVPEGANLGLGCGNSTSSIKVALPNSRLISR
jgi:hypothetical protein